MDEKFLSARQICHLRRIQQELVEKVLKRKARKAKANRKQYLRRRIKELETAVEPAAPMENNEES